MKRLIFVFVCLLIFSIGWADEVVTLKSGKKAILKDNGTWTFLETSTSSNLKNYEKISLVDLKLDINSLIGRKVMTNGVAQYFADMLMLKQEMMDMNPVLVEFKNLSRNERKYVLTRCGTQCDITVFGKVGDVQFQKGIIADKIEW